MVLIACRYGFSQAVTGWNAVMAADGANLSRMNALYKPSGKSLVTYDCHMASAGITEGVANWPVCPDERPSPKFAMQRYDFTKRLAPNVLITNQGLWPLSNPGAVALAPSYF